ncbi:MAG: hypothetical protein ACREQ9_14335, partial [Candidatus Binatia bacterium]
RWSVTLVGVAAIALCVSILRPEALLVAAGAVAAVTLLNRAWFRFLARTQGFAFAAACLPLHLLYFLYSGLSYAFVRFVRRPGVVDRRRLPAASSGVTR